MLDLAALQTELRTKPSTTATISGSQLQSGADASPHRASSISNGRSQRSSSAASGLAGRRSTAMVATAGAGRPISESVLQQWLVPAKTMRYWALWTSIFTLGAAFIFAFMAGNFGVYTQSPTYADYNRGSSTMPVQLQWGPEALLGWLKFWVSSPLNSFDVGYLMNWGARWVWGLDGRLWVGQQDVAGVLRGVMTLANGCCPAQRTACQPVAAMKLIAGPAGRGQCVAMSRPHVFGHEA